MLAILSAFKHNKRELPVYLGLGLCLWVDFSDTAEERIQHVTTSK